MEQEDELNGLELPSNFVGEWFKTDSMVKLTMSKTQSSVSQAMKRIGMDRKEEFLVDIQGAQLVAIDMAVPEQKLGIEVDGPTHFIHNMDKWSIDHETKRRDGHWRWATQEMNGSTALKDRLLQRMGWTIVHVPFWGWNEVEGNARAEDEYLRSVLLLE